MYSYIIQSYFREFYRGCTWQWRGTRKKLWHAEVSTLHDHLDLCRLLVLQGTRPYPDCHQCKPLEKADAFILIPTNRRQMASYLMESCQPINVRSVNISALLKQFDNLLLVSSSTGRQKDTAIGKLNAPGYDPCSGRFSVCFRFFPPS